MRKFRPLVLAASLASGGCITMPPLPSEEQIQIGHIVDRIKCEVGEAAAFIRYHQPNNWNIIRRWVGSFTLKLVLTEQNGVAPSIVVVDVPVGASNLFGLNVPFSTEATSTRTVYVRFGFELANAPGFPCAPTFVGSRLVTSDLGIRDWLVRSLTPFEAQGPSVVPSLAGSTIDFVIASGVQATPGLTLVNASRITNSALLKGSRKDNHNLDAVFQQ